MPSRSVTCCCLPKDEIVGRTFLRRCHTGSCIFLSYQIRAATQPIEYVIERIERNPGSTESLDALAVSPDTQGKGISERLGFYDEYHFRRTFKKLTGKSPTAYRNEVRAGGSAIFAHETD